MFGDFEFAQECVNNNIQPITKNKPKKTKTRTIYNAVQVNKQLKLNVL